MDEETLKEWEKSKRIEKERMKAARELAFHEESKANQAFLTPEKAHGFSRDSNPIMRNAERMANISIVFALLGIVFGFFMKIFVIVSDANKLGMAGSGISMILGIVHGVGIGVAALTGLVALICAVFLVRRIGSNLKSTIITAGAALLIVVADYVLGVLVN